MSTPQLTREQVKKEIEKFKNSTNYVSDLVVSQYTLGRIAFKVGVTPNESAPKDVKAGFEHYARVGT